MLGLFYSRLDWFRGAQIGRFHAFLVIFLPFFSCGGRRWGVLRGVTGGDVAMIDGSIFTFYLQMPNGDMKLTYADEKTVWGRVWES